MSKDNQEPESREKELEEDPEEQEEEEEEESNESTGDKFRIAVPSMTKKSPPDQDALLMVKGVVRVVQAKLGIGVALGTGGGIEVHIQCDGPVQSHRGTVTEGSTSALAPPPNRRASTQRRPPVVPGAYPIQAPHQQRQQGDDSEREMVRVPRAPWDITGGISDGRASDDGGGDDEEDVNSTGGLVIANLVEEFTDLPHAQLERPTDQGEAGRNRAKLEKQFKTTLKLLIGATLTIGILAILVVMLVPKQNDDNSRETHTVNSTMVVDTAIPSLSPSQAATALPDYILSLLPVGSARTIIKEPESSHQAKAFHWLMEDRDNLPGLSDDRIRQKFILATLFYSTEGHHWANDHWLDHSVHECDWFAKSDFALSDTIREWFGPGYMRDLFPSAATSRCSEQGLYEHLWLDQNNLGGSLPTEIFALSCLRSISVGWNRMQGALTTHIGQLTNLMGLVVGHLSGAGPIPSQVGLLTNLQVLALNNNNHQGSLPSEVWQLTNLDTLSLHRNPQLRGTIPTAVGNLDKIRWLAVEGCDFSGTIPTEIGQAALLEWVIAWGNRLTSTLPSEMSQLTQLELIALYGTQLQGTIPSQFGALRNLFVLSLQNNLLSDSLPSELGLLTKLVEGLNVANNQLTGMIPSELGDLAALERLVLSDNAFTGSIPSELGRLEAAQLLAFSNNLLSGTVPHEVGFLQNSLHTLNLEGNLMLSGSIPEAVCNLHGTCIKGPMEACHEPLGLSFDCSSLLCGCGCQCLNG